MNEIVVLIGGGLVVAVLAAFAAWRWCCRGSFVPVHWAFIVAMSLGSLVIAIYYINILTGTPGNVGHFELFGIRGTRWIHGFILFVTAGLSVGALLMARKKNG